MTGRDDRTDEMIALEQARAQLEIGLSGDASWLALHHSPQSAQDGERAAQLERALAGNPLYKSWKLVTEAIDLLRAQQQDQETPEPGPDADMGPPDDLTRIRGISLDLTRRLAVLGVTHYRTIAAWHPVDVSTVSAALGLGRQISRQNWIEQAALLQRRVESSQAGAAATTEDLTAVRSPPAAQEAAAALQAQTEQREIDLPDILEAIRSDSGASGAESPPLASAAESPAYVLHAAEAEFVHAALDAETVAGSEPPPSDDAAERAVSIDEPIATPPAPAERRPAVPTVVASPHIDTDAAERTRRLDEDWQNGPGAGKAEPAEATVTFLIREPVQPGSSNTVELPTVASSQHRASDPVSPPLEAGDGAREPFAPPNSRIDEAEVEILGTGRKKGAGAPATRPTGAVQRLLKTLTGS